MSFLKAKTWLHLLALAFAPSGLALDITPPVISLKGINPATVFVGSTYTDAGATAADTVDGSVTVTVNTSTVNANAVGSYTVSFSATDAANNTATVTRTVNVVSSPVWAENFSLPGGIGLGGIDGEVHAILETSDAIYVGGDFSAVGSVMANDIVRMDKATGAVTPLGSATQNGTNNGESRVQALAMSGTDLYVGGYFSTVSDGTQLNATANSIAKWSTTTNTWSRLSSVTQNEAKIVAVYALAVSGTDVYVGGLKSGVTGDSIAKWSMTTNTWSPLGSATQNGTNDWVRALAISGTDLYVGGDFTTVSDSTQSGVSANRIAKWSTTTDTWSPLGSATQNGTSYQVHALAVSGTDLYVGGLFATVSDNTQNGASAKSIAKWNTTTGRWSPLGTSAQNGTSGRVNALAVSGTDIYVGGAFGTVSDSTQSGASANQVAKWSTVTNTWAPLGSPTQNGTNVNVNALAVSGTDLYAGGGFTTVSDSTQSGASANRIAKWSTTASTWARASPMVTHGNGIDGTVNAIAETSDAIYYGGSFTAVGSVGANNIVRMDKATRAMTPLGSAALNGTNSTVRALAMVGTDLYVGGSFNTVRDSMQSLASVNRIAKWSTITSRWTRLGSTAQNGTSSVVRALAVIGTDLYVGGDFTTVNGSTQLNAQAKYIAKWSTTSSTWAPLGSVTQNGTSSVVNSLAVTGTDLYVGGLFTTVSDSTQNGASASRIAKWSTTTSTWAPLGSPTQNGTNKHINALAVSGTDLFVGGDFTTVNDSTQFNGTANRIAKWSTTSNTWSPLGSVTQNGVDYQVEALAVSGPDLFVGGQFRSVSDSTQLNATAKYIAKWNGNTSTWAPLGSTTHYGTNGTVFALAVSGTELYVGGQFTAVSSTSQPVVASSRLGVYGPISGADISVEQPLGSGLTDGTSTVSFGTVNRGLAGTPVTFTIKNPGTRTLVLGTITVDGTNGSEFIATAPASTVVLPGGSTTFTVTFRPSSGGAKTAELHLASHMSGARNPFDITLTGTGNAGPLPIVTSPTSTTINATSATLGGNVTDGEAAAIIECGVIYSVTTTNNNPLIGGSGVTKVVGTGTTGVFTVGVSGLAPGTGYSFKAYAINIEGTSYTSVATFTTQSDNAKLASLKLSTGVLSAMFMSGSTSHTARVPSTSNPFRVTPTVANAGATVKVNGVSVPSGTASLPIDLSGGQATINIEVTAEDGSTKLYVITATLPPWSVPVAGIGGPYSDAEGSRISLDASSSMNLEGGQSGLVYEWDLDNDGAFDDAIGSHPSLELGDGPSSQMVHLRVLDEDGISATATTTVEVTNRAPVASVICPPTSVIGTPVSINVSAFDGSIADQKAGYSFRADFGDGSAPKSISGASPQFIFHTYSSPGTKTILVTATDKDGGISQAASARITVHSQSVVAAGTPDWSAFGGTTLSYFGARTQSAGDLNGDGYNDIVVGAPGYSLSNRSNLGKVTVFYGGPRGPDSTRSWSFQGTSEQDYLGNGVCGGMDVNGDGYDDLLIGVPGTLGASGGVGNSAPGLVEEAGGLLLFLGGPRGLNATPSWGYVSDEYEKLGSNVAPAGDVNGDGYGDFLAAGPQYGSTDPQTSAYLANCGRVHLFFGSPNGPVGPVWQFVGTQEAHLGSQQGLASGDLNADGYSDLILGAPSAAWPPIAASGKVHLFFGGRGGPAAQPSQTLSHNTVGDGYGAAVACAGDVNGDGYADLAIGVIRYSGGFTNSGAVWVHHGGASGVSQGVSWIKSGDQDLGWVGSSVSGAGDLNGDGYADLLVGARWYDNGQTDEGRAYVFLGGGSGLNSSPAWTYETNQTQQNWSTQINDVATAGDVNGDGVSDILVGSTEFTNTIQREGAIWLFFGSPQKASSPLWTFGTGGGIPNTVTSVVGDVNGDGINDVAVGSVGMGKVDVYLGGAGAVAWSLDPPAGSINFGHAICKLGDINNDGCDDFAVGAPGTRGAGGAMPLEAVPGRVHIYHGSSDGPRAAGVLNSELASEEFGYALAAGDSDGDGRVELLVGAPNFNGSGKVKLYRQTGGTFDAVPFWSDEGLSLDPLSTSARYGAALCSLDYNDDEFADFGIGSPGTMRGKGRYDVRIGGVTPAIQRKVAASFWFDDGMGIGGATLSAGNVYGKGAHAIASGMPTYDLPGNPSFDESQKAQTWGGAVRLDTASGGVQVFRSETPQVGAEFGRAMTVFDFTNDGIDDLLVAAPGHDEAGRADAGLVSCFAGNLVQLGSTPVFKAFGATSSDRFGMSLDGGDLDGDGVPDLIATLGSGGAAVHSYSGRFGSPHIPHLRRLSADGEEAGPFSVDGSIAESSAGLLVKIHAPPLRGRSLARIEWELAPGTASFDGKNIEHGPWTDTGLTGCQLSGKVEGLSENQTYRLRVRVAYHQNAASLAKGLIEASPEWRTKWLSPAGRSSSSIHIRTQRSAQVEGLTVVRDGSGQGVNVTWEGVDGAASYVVERRLTGGTAWQHVGSSTAGSTSFFDASSGPGSFQYRVQALTPAGNRVSSPVSASTVAGQVFGGSYQTSVIRESATFGGEPVDDANLLGVVASGGVSAPNSSESLGDLYGLCREGGLHGVGIVHYQGTPLSHFSDSLTGGHPVGELTRFVLGGHPANNHFFGVCTSGGTWGKGTIFKFDPALRRISTVALFSPWNPVGERPAGGLVLGADGWLYGLMESGGSSNAGTIYRVSPDGTLELVFSFNGTNGRMPQGGLSLDSQTGALYGVTLAGGTSDKGTVFKLLNGQVTTVSDFAAARNGLLAHHPETSVSLVRDSGGNLRIFGTLSVADQGYQGVVFRINPDSSVHYIHAFDGANGADPASPLLIGPSGKLYGLTRLGGEMGGGVIYSVSQTAPGLSGGVPAHDNFISTGPLSVFQPRGALRWIEKDAVIAGVGSENSDGNGAPVVFTLSPQARLASVSSPSATPGQRITLSGTNLEFVTKVTIGGIPIVNLTRGVDGTLSFNVPTNGNLASGNLSLTIGNASIGIPSGFSLRINDSLPDGWQRFYAIDSSDADRDSDSDGFSNSNEAVFGTDPRDRESKPGLDFTLQSDGNRKLEWLSRPYVPVQVESSANLSNWSNLGSARLGTGSRFSLNDSQSAAFRFYRLKANPIGDSDSDGLNDLEETLITSDRLRADSDGDGVGDYEEYLRGTSLFDYYDGSGPSRLLILEGNHQVLAPTSVSTNPLTVAAFDNVNGQVGTFVRDASLTFTVTNGDAKIATAPGIGGVTELALKTDSSGLAKVYLVAGTTEGPVEITIQTTVAGATLSTKAQGHVSRSSAPIPRLVPGYGTFAHPRPVAIVSDAGIGYATDGSDPAQATHPAGTAVMVSSNTTIRARGFGENQVPSAVVSGVYKRISIAAGKSHLLYLDPQGMLHSWGENGFGQLGRPGAPSAGQPVPVPSFLSSGSLTGLAAGDDHSLAVDSSGQVWAWGRNHKGQLGDGSTQDRSAPVRVSQAPRPIRQIAAGGAFTIFLDESGGVSAWGENQHGQLGTGDLVDRHTPIAVTLPGTAQGIAVGASHCLAIVGGSGGSGSLYAWGLNDSGQLGDGSTVNRSQPVAVLGANVPVVRVAASGGRSAALTQSGELYVWGTTRDGYTDPGTGSWVPPVGIPVPTRLIFPASLGAVSADLVVALGFFDRSPVAFLRDGQVLRWPWPGSSSSTDVFTSNSSFGPFADNEPALLTGVSENGTTRISAGLDGSVWFKSDVVSLSRPQPSLIESQDTDGDGLPDAWEIDKFGGLTRSDGLSDADGDGADRTEYQHGTNPRSAVSSPVNLSTDSSSGKEVPGHIASSFNVSESGAATCTVDIRVPKGPGGFGPTLSLVYSSQNNAPGPFGWGWALNGLSVITRGGASLYSDGVVKPVQYNSGDHFYMNGKRLVAIKGERGGDGTEYRTMEQDFSRIVSYGSTGSGPASFRVWTASGLVLDYLPSRSIGGQVSSWGLVRAEDRAGNFMTIRYTADITPDASTVNDWNPTLIEWGGNRRAGTSANLTAEFVYDSAPDSHYSFVNGRRVANSQRLVRIDIKASGELVRRYIPEYRTGRTSLLAAMTEEGQNRERLAKLRFDYGIGDDPSAGVWFETASKYTPPVALAGNSGVQFADLNGDGLTDILVGKKTGGSSDRRAWLNLPGFSPTSNWQPHSGFAPPVDFLDSSLGTRGVQLADLNSDGLVDLVEAHRESGGSVTRRVWLNTGNGWNASGGSLLLLPSDAYLAFTSTGGSYIPTGTQFCDLNADGRPDLLTGLALTGRGTTWKAYLNGGLDPGTGGWFEGHDYGGFSGLGTSGQMLDYNGDGLMDLLYGKERALNVSAPTALKNTGSSFADDPSYASPIDFEKRDAGDNVVSSVVVVDINRDGLPDLWQPWEGGKVAYNTGRGWEVQPAGNLIPLYSDNWKGTGQVVSDTGVRFVDVKGNGFPDQIQLLRKPAWDSSPYNNTASKGEIGWNYQWASGFQGSELIRNRTWFSTSPADNPYPSDFFFVSPFDAGDLGVRLVDVNGDGMADVLAAHPNPGTAGQANTAMLNRAGKVNLLRAISDTQGYRVSLTYGNLSDPSLYTKGTGTQYPSLDMPSTQFVVRDYSETVLGSREQSVEFRYKGLRYDQRGQGSLGFESIEKRNPATGITERTVYRQDYPFVGLPSRVEVRLGDGTLTRETDTAWAEIKDESVSPSLRFVYAGEMVIKGYESNGQFVSQTTTSNTYDNAGHLTYSKTATFSDPGQLFVSETWHTYEDDEGRWLRSRLVETVADHQAPGRPKIQRRARFGYDPVTGLLLSEIVEPGLAQGVTTTREIDLFGNVVKVTSTPNGGGAKRESLTQYDSSGRFAIRQINALGHVARIDPDPVLEVPRWIEDANGLRSEFEYDGFGRAVRIRRPDGTETRIARRIDPGAATYKSSVTTEHSTGEVSVTYHDALERPARGTTFSPDGRLVFSDVVYDSQGRVSKAYRPYFLPDRDATYSQNRATSFTYDLFDRPLTQVTPDGGTTTHGYGPLMTTVTDAKGRTKVTRFDAIGQVVSVTDALGGTVAYRYDSIGNLTETNANGIVTQAAYDVLGRKVSLTDPNLGHWTYGYSSFGELTHQTDAKNQTVTLEYDLIGRLSRRSESEGTTTWIYDTAPGRGIGLPATVQSPGPVREDYTYDSLSRVTQVETQVRSERYTSSLTYDAQSRPLTQVYPTGFATRYVYNAFGSVSAVENAQSGHAYWRADAYNADGSLTEESLGNGLKTTTAYHPATGLLSSIQTGGPGQADVQNLEFTFDEIANLTQRRDVRQGLVEDFSYDALERLTEVKRNGGTAATYTYAINGNLLSRTGTGNYSYGGGGAGPNAVTSITGAQPATYSYDANGNMIGGAGRSITYTSYNAPLQIENATTTISFLHGPGRSRVLQEKTASGSVERTTYIGDYEKTEIGPIGQPPGTSGLVKHTHYIGSPSGTVAVYTSTNILGTVTDSTTYLHRDHLDSVDTVTSTAGDVVERLSYGPFGERRNADGTPPSGQLTSNSLTRGFTGHEHLDSVGLVHMNGRVYDAALGRFISADPNIDGPYSTQGFNRYSYVGNNPLSYSDPSGFWKKPNFGGLGGAAVAVATGGVPGLATAAFLATKQGEKASKWTKDNWKPLVTVTASIAAGAVVTAATGQPILGAAAAGAVGGGLSAYFAGGSPRDIAKAAVIGAAAGAATAAVAQYVGNPVTAIVLYGLIQGSASRAQGGSFKQGFKRGVTQGAIAVSFGALETQMGGPPSGAEAGLAYGVTKAAVSGGAEAEMNGGRWDNGAATGAYSYTAGVGVNIGVRRAASAIRGPNDLRDPNRREIILAQNSIEELEQRAKEKREYELKLLCKYNNCGDRPVMTDSPEYSYSFEDSTTPPPPPAVSPPKTPPPMSSSSSSSPGAFERIWSIIIDGFRAHKIDGRNNDVDMQDDLIRDLQKQENK